MSLPEGPAGQRLAVAILLALLVGGWVLLVQPLLDRRADEIEAIAQKELLAARFARAAAELPALRRAAAFVEQRPADRLLQGDSDAVAAARLADLVKQVVVEAGGTLRSIETLPAVRLEGGRRKVGIRLAVDGTLPAFVQGLDGLSRVPPLLLVDQLVLRRAGGSVQPSQDPSLAIGFDVFGFRPG